MSCKARTKTGEPCSANAGASGLCWAHDPALGAKRAEAHKHGGRQIRKGMATPFPNDADVKTAVGLRRYMEQVIKETWQLEPGISRSRTLGYLAQVQKGVLETGELEERVKAIETALTARKEGQHGT